MVSADDRSSVFEDRLLGELHRLHGQSAGCGNAPGRRATVRRRVVAGVSVAAAAGPTIGPVVALPPTSPNRGPGPKALSLPGAEPLSVLRVQMVSSISAANSSSVFHSQATMATGSMQVWADPAGNATRSLQSNGSGQPVSEFATRPDPNNPGETQVLWIGYAQHEFSLRDVPPPSSGPTPTVPNPASASAQQLQQDMASGRAVALGTDVVNGQAAERIAITASDGSQATLWIAEATNLPVKQTTSFGTATYSWLPQNAQSKAMTWDTPPSGFAQVGTPPLPPGL